MKVRDGGRCANPGCGHRDHLHAHHIAFRSHGGRTLAENEVAVCTTCHALIHAGLLEVTGTPGDGLQWRPRSAGLDVSSEADAWTLAEVPTVTVQSAIADTSAVHDMSDAAIDLADLARSLVNLGLPREAAMDRLERARHELEARGTPLTEDELLRRALSA